MRIRPFLALLLILGAPTVVRAQEAADAGPTGVLTRAPELLHFVPATYPPEAQAAHLQGEVLLQIDLDALGNVTQELVLTPAGHGFDAAALAAVKQFRFRPAEIDGKPAPVRLTYRYTFVFTPEVTPDAGSLAPAHLVTFDGTILERGTRAPLGFAQVVVQLPGLDGGAPPVETTDAAGRFAFEDLAPGTYAISVVATDHQRFETRETIAPGQVTHATYYARRKVYSAFETVVTAAREKKEVARTTLKQEEIRLIPGTQGDALKVVQNLPGVARAPYGIGLLVVRGSKPWDTRVYIDDAQIPQLFHFGGLKSVFNADLLEDISFQPGNFNVDFGRSIGGLVTARTREPSTKGFHGYLDVNVIDASLLLEGPLSDELSLAVAGRRSYIDAVLAVALPDSLGLDFTVAPRYWDYQLKLDYHPHGGRDRVTVTAFGSDDVLSLLLQNAASVDPEARATVSSHVGFDLVSAVWTRKLSLGVSNRLSLEVGYTNFNNAFGGDIAANTDTYPFLIRDTLHGEPAPWLALEGGLDVQGIPYRYSASTPTFFQFDEVPDPIASRQLVTDSGTGFIFEPALFAQAIVKTPGGGKLIPGLRADFDRTMNKGWVDPRIALLQPVGLSTTLKAAAGLYHQPPDFRQGLLLPSFGNPDLLPEASQQYLVGVEQKLLEGLSLDVQVYYKWLFHQVQTSSAIVEREGQEVAQRYDSGGAGRSYGVEVLLRKALTQRMFGWISYSLEKTELCSASFSLTGARPHCTPFGGEGWTTFPLDQPHHLVAVLSYKLPRDWTVGIRGQYASGNPVTPVASAVYDADGDSYFPIPGASLTERVPAFFQLDVRVDKRFVFERWMLTVYLDVQNVTSRRNPEYTLYNFDFTQRGYLSGLPIVPDLGVKGEF